MGTLGKAEIIERLKRNELLKNAHMDEKCEYDVEPASYDLRAGTIIWKEHNPLNGENKICIQKYEPGKNLADQSTVTLQPGQVMFVISLEEVIMPPDLCGTVYAKNKFSRDGILALTTGHIDPGVRCPIVIRLINLRSIPYTFMLGEQIYTIVFHNLHKTDEMQLISHPPISMETTIMKTIESANAALGNALNDISLTHNFVRKDDFERLKADCQNYLTDDQVFAALFKKAKKKAWAWALVIFAIGGFIAAVVKVIEFVQKQGQ